MLNLKKQWDSFLEAHKTILTQNSRFEYYFADRVLRNVNGLNPDNIEMQRDFTDRNNKTRRVDFAIILNGQFRIAIEVDGYDKRGTGGPMSRSDWDDFLFRQNELLILGVSLLRFSNDSFMAHPHVAIHQIQDLLKITTQIHLPAEEQETNFRCTSFIIEDDIDIAEIDGERNKAYSNKNKIEAVATPKALSSNQPESSNGLFWFVVSMAALVNLGSRFFDNTSTPDQTAIRANSDKTTIIFRQVNIGDYCDSTTILCSNGLICQSNVCIRLENKSMNPLPTKPLIPSQQKSVAAESKLKRQPHSNTQYTPQTIELEVPTQVLPKNAHAYFDGKRWGFECDIGYRKYENGCVMNFPESEVERIGEDARIAKSTTNANHEANESQHIKILNCELGSRQIGAKCIEENRPYWRD